MCYRLLWHGASGLQRCYHGDNNYPDWVMWLQGKVTFLWVPYLSHPHNNIDEYIIRAPVSQKNVFWPHQTLFLQLTLKSSQVSGLHGSSLTSMDRCAGFQLFPHHRVCCLFSTTITTTTTILLLMTTRIESVDFSGNFLASLPLALAALNTLRQDPLLSWGWTRGPGLQGD